MHAEHGVKRLEHLLNLPPGTLEPDAPLPAGLHPKSAIEGAKSLYTLVVELAGRERLTVRQLIGRLGGGRGHLTFAGTPEQVADTIENWFTHGAADGFNIMPAVLPSGLGLFVDHVVPILRAPRPAPHGVRAAADPAGALRASASRQPPLPPVHGLARTGRTPVSCTRHRLKGPLMPDIEIRKVTGTIGAQVFGVDISRPLDGRTVTSLREALSRHKALVFDDMELDDEGQQAFARHFGDLTAAHPTVPAVEGAPNVLPVDSERGRANHWHTDVTFVLNPPQAGTLRSITVPPYGGETLIADSAAAYRDLPEPLRRFADTLWAEHTNDYDCAVPDEAIDAEKAARRAQFTSITYRTAHPVVRVHPLTGERGLYIGGFAQRIVGLSVPGSRRILDLLQAYVTRPENVLRRRWSPRQLVLFDNRITQHYAIDNYDGLPRRLHRVTVAGDIPVGVEGKESHSVQGDASHCTPVAA